MKRVHRRAVAFMVAGALTMPLTTPWAAGQGSADTSAKAPSPQKAWVLTRTPWGDPDLQGVWDQTMGTPLERPKALAGREVLSDEEAVDGERRRFAAFDKSGRADGTGDYGSVWREGSKNALNRTSLIVDPRDGRLPPLTAAGQKAASARSEQRRLRPADTWEDRSLWERCITRGTPRIPNNYNSNWHILQTPHYVVIEQEMIHETRIIPLDDRARVGSRVRQWLGEPRGPMGGDNPCRRNHGFRPTAGVQRPGAGKRTYGGALHADRREHHGLSVHD